MSLNSCNIGQYYDYAFQLLEFGKSLEGTGQIQEAIGNAYAPACFQFHQLLEVETDDSKKELLRQQLRYFENRILQLSQAAGSGFYQTLSAKQRLYLQAINAFEEAAKLETTFKPDSDRSQLKELYLKAADLFIQLSSLPDCNCYEVNSFKGMASVALDRVDRMLNVSWATLPKSSVGGADEEDLFAEFDEVLPSVDPPQTLNQPKKVNPAYQKITPSVQNIKNNRPRSSGDLSVGEISILRRSSFINGRCFLPWADDEKSETFRLGAGKRFTDPDGLLPLSSEQNAKQARYKRIHEIVASTGNTDPVLIKCVSSLAITQDLVADCSFVCSLCIAAAYEARFQKKLITSIIYPQNERGVPVYNPSGKYLVKLFMNGVMRKVVVDDYLPVETIRNSRGKEVYRLLCSYSLDPTEMWISLIEKAYMKLNGGYDFPGSNSGIDLHALTGWIPEQVFFAEDKDSHASAESTTKPLGHRQRETDVWERISSAHQFGDCLITISTSNSLSKADEELSGLVPGHAYAVLNVRAAGTLRMLQVKNPWARRGWRGRFSSNDRERWTPGLKQALGVSDSDFDKMDRQGVFWIDFVDCRKYFKSFFLNWNPALFLFRTTLHDMWPVQLGPKLDSYYIGASPQYRLVVQGSKGDTRSTPQLKGVGTSIWVLLTRHVVTKEVDPDRLSSASPAEAETFLTMHIHRGGKRIYAPCQPMIKGVYSSDPHVLSRVDISESETAEALRDASLDNPNGRPIEFTLVLSQAEKHCDVYYSLSAYSTALPFSLMPIPPLPSNQLTISGSWKAGVTAGGPTHSPLFYTNPQYRLHIPAVVRGGIDMHIHAMFSKDISASISVVDVIKNSVDKKSSQSGAEDSSTAYARIDCIASDEAEILTSGPYRNGYCVCSTSIKAQEGKDNKERLRNRRGKSCNLQAGDYTVVISAYSTQSVGNFALTFATTAGALREGDSDHGLVQPRHNKKYFSVKEIPPEGWGMTNVFDDHRWAEAEGTAVGCSNYGQYHLNPIYFLHLPQDTTISIRLNVKDPSAHRDVGLNVAVYELSGLVSSEEHSTLATMKPYDVYSDWLRKSNAAPRAAKLTSSGGTYVVRPSGAFAAPCLLGAGAYLIVPSTFEPMACKYVMSVFLTPATTKMSGFSFVRAKS